MAGNGKASLARILRKRGAITVATIGALFLFGLAIRPLEGPLWNEVKKGQPEMNLGDLEEALGQGVLIGVLGGFRNILADFLWIQTNAYWQRRDRPKTETMIRLVTRIDPRPDFFWINGARMIAYDIPNWRIRELGGYDAVPATVRSAIDHEQAMRGIDLIKEAKAFHPDNPRMPLEIAQILNNRLDATEEAADWFRRAAEMPGAPRYAGRIHAELLRRLDRPREAYEYLILHYESLPDWNHPMAEIVLERIRELEREIRVPVPRRYFPRRDTHQTNLPDAS